MKVAWFLTFRDDAKPGLRITEAERVRVLDIVAATPKLAKGLVFTPEEITGLYFDDGPSPQLALELYFDDIAHLEAALARDGHLQALAAPGTLPSLAGAAVTQQAMLAREFPVPDPEFRNPAGTPHCTYLVHYPGQAEDLNEWLAHYLAHHTAVMATFPGIREVEVCTRLNWTGFLPWPRVDYIQRNKVVFDSGEALAAALRSPVMKEMRADFHKFPPFTGGNIHYPMATWVAGGRG